MYFNNIHIKFYVLIAILGFVVGKFVAWCNLRFPEDKKIFSKEFFKENKAGNIKGSYIMMIITACFYIAILYKFGLKQGVIKNLDLIKFLILTPMLISSFFIDLKHRILPNRLNMTMFEIGILFVFIYGLNNLNIAKDMVLGLITGGGIFLAITLLGGMLAGKEAMGLGDVKFMGALGLYFGYSTIAEISLLAFFLATVISLIVLFIRIVILKSDDEYIPFGPFLVASAFCMMFIPAGTVFMTFIGFCKWISDKLVLIGHGEI